METSYEKYDKMPGNIALDAAINEFWKRRGIAEETIALIEEYDTKGKREGYRAIYAWPAGPTETGEEIYYMYDWYEGQKYKIVGIFDMLNSIVDYWISIPGIGTMPKERSNNYE